VSRAHTLGRVWLAAAALAAGAIAGLHGVDAAAGWAACVGAIGGLALRRRPLVRAAAIAIAAFGLGAISGAAEVQRVAPARALAVNVPHCDLNGRVLEHAGGLGTLIALDVLRCEGYPPIENAGVAVADLSRADPGARVRMTGWIVPLGTDSFDAARRRLGADAAFDAREIEVGSVDGPFNKAAAGFRGSLRKATSSLGADRASLTRGLSIGDTTDMPPRLEEDLRRAGLTHLVAVSGSNVAIVLTVVTFVVRRLGAGTRFTVGLCALGFYVLVVGPEPSVLRAAVMGGIALAALTYGRRSEPLHALGLALMAVVAVRPGLALSVGLHLSAAATAGIVLWAERLTRWLAPLPSVVTVPLAVTLAAQIAVAPILALVFGQLSLTAPLANLLAAPAVAPATVLALTAGAAGLAFPGTAAVLAQIAGWFAWLIAVVGHRLGGGTWSAIEVPAIAGWVLAGAVVMMAVVGLRARDDA
jgi:competence protein ComEC